MSGGGASNAWLQCTHVAEGHAGAALTLAATSHMLYSGGVGKILIFYSQFYEKSGLIPRYL